LLVLILIAGVFKIYSYTWPMIDLRLGDKDLKLQLADTTDHLYQGLSGRQKIGNYDGVAFVFQNLEQHTMVMRDMNFPIDIVWIKSVSSSIKCSLNSFSLRSLLTGFFDNCSGEVVDIAPNVTSQDNVSVEDLTPYIARDQSTMVLELPAGFAQNNSIKIGDKVEVK